MSAEDIATAITALVKATKPFARGGFSEVFAYEGRLVKVGLGEREHHNKMLEDEAGYLQQLAGCSQVVDMFGVHKINAPHPRVALVLEKMDGDLASVIERRALTRGEVAWVAQSMARALAAMEHLSLTHGDVKPSNILLRGEDVKIADFGTATLTATRPTSITTGYQAPEFLVGAKKSGRCFEADMWCLGVTLLECTERANPFDIPAAAALMKVLSTAVPPFPHPLDGMHADLTEHWHAMSLDPPEVDPLRDVIVAQPILGALLHMAPAARASPAELLAIGDVKNAVAVDILAATAGDDGDRRD